MEILTDIEIEKEAIAQTERNHQEKFDILEEKVEKIERKLDDTTNLSKINYKFN